MSEIVWVLIRVVSLAGALLLLPLGMGNLFMFKTDFDKGLVFLFGLCVFFAVFELVYLPFFILGGSFSLLTVLFFTLSAALALAGFFLKYKHPGVPSQREKLTRREWVLLALAAVVVLWQVLRTTLGGGTWNIDDAWYLGLANTAIYADDVMRTDPTTGFALNYLEYMKWFLTYVFSPWPLFLAALSQLFSFTPLVMARTVLPGFIIVLFYYVVYRVVSFFFKGDREKALFALLLLSVFYEICAVAMNLRYTWIICYPWMGKAFGPSIICPVALWFFFLIEEETDAKRRRLLWLGIFLANVAGCMVASSSAEMILMLLGCWGLVHVIRTRDWGCIWRLALAVSPSFALMSAHFMM